MNTRIPYTLARLAVAAFIVSAQSARVSAQAPAWTYSLEKARGADGYVIERSEVFRNYNYDPTVILEKGVYRAWWCGNARGAEGDQILYAEASKLGGPWHARSSDVANSYDVVFSATGNSADFDGFHVCDPTIIRHGDAYYMYYTATARQADDVPNEVGVAISGDGLAWKRLNDGKSIVRPVNRRKSDGYGAGQQSVAFARDWFYMIYNDHSGDAALTNGAGVFVIRARDALFQRDTQVLTADGFKPRTEKNATAHMVYNGNNVDMLYVPTWRQFVIASHRESGVVHFVLFDEQFHELSDQVLSQAKWCDGPGLIGDAGRQAIMRDDGDAIALDVMFGSGNCRDPLTWRLGWRGADLVRRAASGK